MIKKAYIRLLSMVGVGCMTFILFTTVAYAFTPPNVQGISRFTNNAMVNLNNNNKFAPNNNLFAIPKSKNYFNNKKDNDISNTIRTSTTEPTPVLYDSIRQLSLPAATIALSAILASSTLLLPMNADAAVSGGRMGGSFSSPSSSRSSSYYGGSSRGYSSSRSYYYSRPSSTIVAPIIVPSPFSPVVPFYGGGYGYGGGAGVISYSRGPSIFDFLVIGGIGLFIVNAISQTARSVVDSSTEYGSSSFLPWSTSSGTTTALGTGSSVVQISIAMNVPNRDDPNSILNILDKLAQTSKTDNRVGVQQLTNQVAIELLRKKSSFVAGYLDAQHYDSTSKTQREYNRRSVQERSKFEKEVVSKYGGVDYNSRQLLSPSVRGSGGSSTNALLSTMAVVTILLNIAGDTTVQGIPKYPIRSVKDLEKALQRIASDVVVDDCLTSAEILWTPEDRSESLSFRDIIADYPELVNV